MITSTVMVPFQPTFADMFGSVCPGSHTVLGIERLASVPSDPVTLVGVTVRVFAVFKSTCGL